MEIRYEAPGVRADLAAAHARYWRRLGRPGANWSGAERVAIAREVRHASGCAFCRRLRAALSPYAESGIHDLDPGNSDLLPAAAAEAIHRIVNGCVPQTDVDIARSSSAGVPATAHSFPARAPAAPGVSSGRGASPSSPFVVCALRCAIQ